jgi:hypothetical protein
MDFKVSYLETPIVILEDKQLAGDSLLDGIKQAHRYCTNNDISENMFVIVVRDTKFTAFLHQLD